MSQFRVLSASEQVAAHLRDQLSRGGWTQYMPGGERLSRELSVGRMTVEAALGLLENEGILISQGSGRRRLIDLPERLATPSLRIGIFFYAPPDSQIYYNVDLQHQLLHAGHFTRVTPKSLTELGMDPKRISKIVEKTPADAWIVSSGSREVLQWFAEHRLPTFAFAGRRRGIDIASVGPDKIFALRNLIQKLVSLGHRRIVMLACDVLRKPKPGAFEAAFLEELEAHEIQHGPYNLPAWTETSEGLQDILDSLFQHTPPTAIILGEAHTFIAAQQHLAQRGILAPRDVSLICDDPDPAFAWCCPSIAHIRWDGSPVAKRAVRWANNIARGKDDRRKSFTKAEFIEGGTMGPASHSR